MDKTEISRRRFLVTGTVLGAGSVAVACSTSKADATATPAQTEGPFYPTVDQADKDADLTLVDGHSEAALGEVVRVEGRVLDRQGKAIAGAVVDIWQANAAGRYAHELDPNPAPLDPNFQGWAILSTDTTGRYGFKTIKPGAYPAEPGWDRPPHIHFKVSRRGYKEITTQMYFDGEPLNAPDLVLNALSDEEKAMVVARPSGENGAYRFDVVLEKV